MTFLPVLASCSVWSDPVVVTKPEVVGCVSPGPIVVNKPPMADIELVRPIKKLPNGKFVADESSNVYVGFTKDGYLEFTDKFGRFVTYARTMESAIDLENERRLRCSQ